MRFGILIILILLPSGILSAQEEGIYIKWDYSGLSFREFADRAEKSDSIRFFFREEWVNNLKLGDYNGPVLLPELLNSVFRGSQLYFFISRNRDVVITNDFAVRIPTKQSGEDQNFIPATDYSSQDNQKMNGNVFVDIGNPADKKKAGNVELSGYITNRDTREPVAGVTVFNQKLSVGTISNQHGFYTLSLPRGSHLVQFSFIGMKEKSVNANIYGNGEMNVEMNSVLIPLKETVISAQRDMVLQRFEVGMEKINISSFRLLPTSIGESDIIKSVLLIPGVQSVGEGSSGFNVRGGSADQNLILLYGAPVYNSSHFFGFFSAVNSDIIKDVTFYKGGIPARFGGRISSILDIGTTEGNRKAFKGNAGISPITTHLMVEGPIIKDTCTFILTGRTTYSNWLLKLIDNNAISNSSAFFYDLNGKVTYDMNKDNKIDLSSYMSHDDFRFNSDTSYRYDNYILSLRWRHFFNSRFFSSLTLNHSSYAYNMSSNSSAKEEFEMTHKINSQGFKADFNFFPGRHEFNYGLDMTHYSVLPGSYQPASDSSLVTPVLSLGKKLSKQPSIWKTSSP